MKRLTRREFLSLSAATAAGLTLAACQPVQPLTPVPQEAALAAPAVPPLEEVSLLDAETQAKIENVVQFMMDDNQVPGLIAGIMQDGQVTYAKGFGVAEMGTEQPVSPQSVFQIMNMTHLFTAAAAMQLVEQGKLDLDAPIIEYLPYFKLADDRYTQITMRHLLLETAGLPPTPDWDPALDWEGKTPQTDEGALERYVRSLSDTGLPGEFGLGRVFCNMGYDIAGDVIAKASGQVFEEYMHQHILQPLGMAQSTFYPDQVDPELRVAQHMENVLDVEVSELVTWSRERAPSVGLFSNLADLLRWTQANLNRGEMDGVRFLEESSFDDEIWKPQVSYWPGGGAQRDASFGWILDTNSGHPICEYWGADAGFHGAIYLAPEDNAGAVVLGNQYAGTTPLYARDIASLALQAIALE